jgi:large subunit ribosomal protein L10e
MRGAFGKPTGLTARVNIGQILITVRCKEKDVPAAVEGLRRSKFKFAGQQKIVVSNKWGFTDLTREEYIKRKEEGKLVNKGAHVSVFNGRGPLAAAPILVTRA